MLRLPSYLVSGPQTLQLINPFTEFHTVHQPSTIYYMKNNLINCNLTNNNTKKNNDKPLDNPISIVYFGEPGCGGQDLHCKSLMATDGNKGSFI